VIKRRDLAGILEEGEGLQIEFKMKFSSPEKIAKEMIAFANTRGGYIFFGIDDSGDIFGVESEKGEADQIREAAEKYCEPPLAYKIQYLPYDDKEIVIVEIPESKVKPHRIQDYKAEIDVSTAAVYVRVGEKSVPASKEMIRFMRSAGAGKTLEKYSIGTLEKAVFQYLQQHESVTAEELAGLLNVSGRRASRTLVKLVRAGLLLIHTRGNGESYFTPME